MDSMSATTQWTVDTSVVDPMAGIVSLTTCRMKFFHASWQHSLFVLRKTKFKKTEIKIKLNFSFFGIQWATALSVSNCERQVNSSAKPFRFCQGSLRDARLKLISRPRGRQQKLPFASIYNYGSKKTRNTGRSKHRAENGQRLKAGGSSMLVLHITC